MKILAWMYTVIASLFAILALSDRLFIPAFIFILSALLTAPLVALIPLRERFGLIGNVRWWAIVISGFSAIVILGATIPETPERRAERVKMEQARTAANVAASNRAAEAKAVEDKRIAVEKALTDEKVAADKALADAKAAEENKNGFHCLSSWDGSHRGVVDALKESLRDPDSFQHVETRITPTDSKGNHMLMMKYRAKNGFGGMNVGQLAAIVKDSDCSFDIVANDSN